VVYKEKGVRTQRGGHTVSAQGCHRELTPPDLEPLIRLVAAGCVTPHQRYRLGKLRTLLYGYYKNLERGELLGSPRRSPMQTAR